MKILYWISKTFRSKPIKCDKRSKFSQEVEMAAANRLKSGGQHIASRPRSESE